MSTTDYPAPCRIVDADGQTYRLQFRSPTNSTATAGQLVAIPHGDTDTPPIELTKDGVHQRDIDTEITRWLEWPSIIRPGDDGYSSELTLTEVQRRFTNAGLQASTDDA